MGGTFDHSLLVQASMKEGEATLLQNWEEVVILAEGQLVGSYCL
jgi:hypothetical protein